MAGNILSPFWQQVLPWNHEIVFHVCSLPFLRVSAQWIFQAWTTGGQSSSLASKNRFSFLMTPATHAQGILQNPNMTGFAARNFTADFHMFSCTLFQESMLKVPSQLSHPLRDRLHEGNQPFLSQTWRDSELMEEILHQLRLVVYPIIYNRVLYIPGGWPDFFHQHYVRLIFKNPCPKKEP